MSLIVGESLILPDQLPEPRDSIPAYRVAEPRTFARGDAGVRRMFDERVARWSAVFGVDAEPRDLGDRMLFLADDAALEVYLPSDSVWWSDRRLAFAEQPPSEPLPDATDATERARQLLEELGVAEDALDGADVTHTNAAVASSPEDRPSTARTTVTVRFRYALDGVPVVGPGARVRVTYGGGGTLAEFARFWRTAQPVRALRPIHPFQAIERLANDARFAQVGEAGCEVVVEGFGLGHYAAGPGHFQRYLVPVYEARGRVDGGELEEDVFNVFIPAVDADSATLKLDPLRDRPVFRPVFTGF